jgi:hypothetical protein
MYELAGEVADIVLVANYVDRDGIRWGRERLGAGIGRRAPGLGQPEVLWRVDVCTSDDGEQARRFMAERVARHLRSGYYGASFLRPMGLDGLAGSADDGDVTRVLDAVALAGRPADLARRAAGAMAAGSFDGICCRMEVLPGQDVLRTLEGLSDLLDLAMDQAGTRR